MCFRHKNKKQSVTIESRFHVGDFVKFKDKRDGVCPGYIYEVKLENDEIVYTLQVGGECPSFRYHIKESEIIQK